MFKAMKSSGTKQQDYLLATIPFETAERCDLVLPIDF